MMDGIFVCLLPTNSPLRGLNSGHLSNETHTLTKWTSEIWLIRKIIFNFLWSGRLNYAKFHLSSWKILCLTKILGGWGLKNIFWFGDALGQKNLWRYLFSNDLRSDVLKCKYIKTFFISQWLRDSLSLSSNASIIWKGIYRSLHLSRKRLSCNIGRGI